MDLFERRHQLLLEEWTEHNEDASGDSCSVTGGNTTLETTGNDDNRQQNDLGPGVNPDRNEEVNGSTSVFYASLTQSETISTRRMECLRGSKFAQLLGFGHGPPDETFPVTMATLDGRDMSGNELPDMDMGGSGTDVNQPTTLDPNYYQAGRQVVDGQWATWCFNYQEAAIYLEEGENNDMFSTHPRRRESLPAYILAHTKWFYLLDWMASMVLLTLAIFERPAIFEVPIGIHASLELGALTIITFGLVLKMRWLGLRTTLGHQRTLIKAITLLVMFIEAILILVRQQSHFRVTRALRPIFLVDNRYLRGVRRFSRQVLQSMPPILDMLILLLFFILMFSLLGNFLFGEHGDPFFSTAEDSFVNLFVLLTTANYPDIQMPAYYRSKWAVFFFVIYLVTVLYLFMNLLLAVVYEAFTTLEKEKFRKLIIHKQKASNYAFNLLVSKGNPNAIIFRHFHGTMTYIDPNKSLRDIYLCFRALNTSGSGVLSREEFSKFYEVFNLSWKPSHIKPKPGWTFFRDFGRKLQNLLELPHANHVFNFVIILNGVATLIHCYGGISLQYWDSYIFLLLFIIEVILKIATWGPEHFFSSGWNTFDFISTLMFLFSLLLVQFLSSWEKLLTLVRPLRILRLFKLKKRYRNIFGTVFILIPPMVSVAVVILLLYYFFAIIGMEIFGQVQLINCCQGTIFEDFYKNSTNSSSSQVLLRYYLNSFGDIFSSFVTLFELTVVNNWYIIMEGHRIASGTRLSRLYFIIFYLVTMCLLTVVIAFILDTFLFRIRYKREMDKKTEQKMLRREVALSADEIDFCYSTRYGQTIKKAEILADYGEDLASKGYLTYVGSRRRTKEILLKRMFQDEIATWIRETDPTADPVPTTSRSSGSLPQSLTIN